MKVLSVHRAPDSEELVINIRESVAEALKSPIQDGPTGLTAQAHLITFEAEEIAMALHNALPQAVAVRVGLKLMQLHATNHLGGPRR